MDIIKQIEREHMRMDIPAFKPGDAVKVYLRIVEGEKERIQMFLLASTTCVSCAARLPASSPATATKIPARLYRASFQVPTIPSGPSGRGSFLYQP